MSEVFVSTDVRRASSHGVILKHDGHRILEVQVRTPSSSRGMGTFFPSCRQLYLSSFSDIFTHARARACAHMHVHTHLGLGNFFSLFSARMTVIDSRNGPRTLVVVFFALCLLLLEVSLVLLAIRLAFFFFFLLYMTHTPHTHARASTLCLLLLT